MIQRNRQAPIAVIIPALQPEREIAGERIRVNRGIKDKGHVDGRQCVLRYDDSDLKLIVTETEAAIVQLTFRLYEELVAVALLKAGLEL